MPQTTENTTAEQLESILDGANRAYGPWSRFAPAQRADVLDKVADALDAAAGDLIPVAMRETNLPEGRLTGELKRTSFQLRLFGELLRDGGFLDARIDHADAQWPMGAPRPDLRRSYRPLGPVLVFSASNFPFAFSAEALAHGQDDNEMLDTSTMLLTPVGAGRPESR